MDFLFTSATRSQLFPDYISRCTEITVKGLKQFDRCCVFRGSFKHAANQNIVQKKSFGL